MRYAVASDIHLGHLKTPTQHIINSFKTTILTEENKTLDINEYEKKRKMFSRQQLFVRTVLAFAAGFIVAELRARPDFNEGYECGRR